MTIKMIAHAYKTIGFWIILSGFLLDREIGLAIGATMLVIAWYLLDFHYSKSQGEDT